jgi:hypothetical protein
MPKLRLRSKGKELLVRDGFERNMEVSIFDQTGEVSVPCSTKRKEEQRMKDVADVHHISSQTASHLGFSMEARLIQLERKEREVIWESF